MRVRLPAGPSAHHVTCPVPACGRVRPRPCRSRPRTVAGTWWSDHGYGGTPDGGEPPCVCVRFCRDPLCEVVQPIESSAGRSYLGIRTTVNIDRHGCLSAAWRAVASVLLMVAVAVFDDR
ncbi:hypothetical protein GCM10009779_60360 [Polymorphospora rubra]